MASRHITNTASTHEVAVAVLTALRHGEFGTADDLLAGLPARLDVHCAAGRLAEIAVTALQALSQVSGTDVDDMLRGLGAQAAMRGC